jgi:hypothetical protein
VIDVCALPLSAGKHDKPEDGMCVMEMASYLAREPWTDAPACVSPVIATFCRSWNDALDQERRQRLKPYAFKVVGTNTGPADDEARAWMATDWLCRVHAPAWLRLAKLDDHARALESLARITDAVTAGKAQPTLAAARAAARAAAWDAAGAAAWDAAGDAARDAAWDAARAAAWDAAGAAARDAAGDALAPTVLALQESAFGLLDEMIAVGAKEAK